MNHWESTRHGVRWSRLATALALLASAAAAQAEGLVLRAPEASLTLQSPDQYALARTRAQPNSIHLFGDYYLFDPARSNMGPTMSSLIGGFRLSTGVAGIGQRVSLFDTAPEATRSVPYLGLGYSHLWFTGQLSLNADLGVASQYGLGGSLRGLAGTQSLDDVARDLRWGPIMAINVSYSF
jgi:hypothetical protein